MRQVTKTIDLYDYNDLLLQENQELKELVLTNYRDINLDWFDDIGEFDDIYITDIESQGFINPKIYYDLSYSQGSGACFDTNEFDYDKLLEKFNCKHKKWILNIIKDYCECKISRNYYANYYSHSRTREFELYYPYEHERILNILAHAAAYIQSLYEDTAQKLYRDLCKEYEYQQSDTAILETIAANEYEFTSNGRIYNG